jgi:transcriptional pleiotropic regulator of transition state genes
MQSDEVNPDGSATKPVCAVRRVDALGRIVLPSAMRKMLGIRHGDLLEARLEDGRVVIVKVERECTFCSGRDDLIEMNDKHVCNRCVSGLVERSVADVEARVWSGSLAR